MITILIIKIYLKFKSKFIIYLLKSVKIINKLIIINDRL